MSIVLTTRPATEDDCGILLRLITELADYEKLTHEVVATEESLRHTLFGANRAAEAMIGCVNGLPVGMAIFFRIIPRFWLGQDSIWKTSTCSLRIAE